MKTNKIVVTPFPRVTTDAGICDVARVSFAKTADQFTEDQNRGLLRYLAKNGHWSPFGHARLIFVFRCKADEMLPFFMGAQLAGFTWGYSTEYNEFCLNGSLWAFYENIQHLPSWSRATIMETINREFPWSCPNLFSLDQFAVADDVSNPDRISYSGHELLLKREENAHLHYATFRVVAPIFLARQAVKHQIHLCWNEESRRYIDEEPVYFEVDEWRGRPEKSMKQGSSGVIELPPELKARVDAWGPAATALYNDLLAAGVAPELARAKLPLDLQVEWIWTGSVPAWKRICRLRLDGHAQKEAQVFAQQVDAVMREEYAAIWDRL